MFSYLLYFVACRKHTFGNVLLRSCQKCLRLNNMNCTDKKDWTLTRAWLFTNINKMSRVYDQVSLYGFLLVITYLWTLILPWLRILTHKSTCYELIWVYLSPSLARMYDPWKKKSETYKFLQGKNYRSTAPSCYEPKMCSLSVSPKNHNIDWWGGGGGDNYLYGFQEHFQGF